MNEQWPDYWADKFAGFGFEVFDPIRPAVWDDVRIEPWYRQNMLLFSRGSAADRLRRIPPRPMPIRVVHPDLLGR